MGEFSNCGDKKIGKFLEIFLFFSVNSEKNYFKTCPNQKFGGEKEKTWKFDAGFWGTDQQAQGFYLPTYLDEPFCLDPYILGYLLIGRRVGTQNGGSEEDLGIPTLPFFFFLLLLLFVHRCERFGRETGAELAGERRR